MIFKQTKRTTKSGAPMYRGQFRNARTRWAHLNKPNDRFESEKGKQKYSTELLYAADSEQHRELAAELEAIRDEYYDQVVSELKAGSKKDQERAKALTKRPVFQIAYDQDDKDTGDVWIRTSTPGYRNVGTKDAPQWEQKNVRIYDVKGKLLTGDAVPQIYSGWIVHCDVTAFAYVNDAAKEVGVAFGFNALQIIEQAEYDSNPFADESGADDEGDDKPAASADDDEDEDDFE